VRFLFLLSTVAMFAFGVVGSDEFVFFFSLIEETFDLY
jgi:hypothetical protein